MNNGVCSEGTYEVTRKMSEEKGSCILDRLVWTSVAGLIKNCQGEKLCISSDAGPYNSVINGPSSVPMRA